MAQTIPLVVAVATMVAVVLVGIMTVVLVQVVVHPIQQIPHFRYYQVLTVQTDAPHPLLVTQDMYQV
jgi:hypothetical protein